MCIWKLVCFLIIICVIYVTKEEVKNGRAHGICGCLVIRETTQLPSLFPFCLGKVNQWVDLIKDILKEAPSLLSYTLEGLFVCLFEKCTNPFDGELQSLLT